SADSSAWTTVYTFSGTRVSASANGETVTLATPAENVRYVRLQASADANGTAGWANVNLWEIEIYGELDLTPIDTPISTPNRNLCRPIDNVRVTATASSVEANTSFTADKAIDGDTTEKANRWSSANESAAQWLQIDLGTTRSVSLVKLYWERANVTAYTLQVSADGTTWTTVHEATSRITQTNEVIPFPSRNIRFIKVNCTGHDDYGASSYRNIALYEVEAFRDFDAIPVAPSVILAQVTAINDGVDGTPFQIITDNNNKPVRLALTDAAQAVMDGYSDATLTFSANLEQVVGENGVIYTPVCDKEVALDVTVTDSVGDSASTPANDPIYVTIPGARTTTPNDGNPKPAVIPEIMEWFSPNDSASQTASYTGYYGKSYELPTDGSKVRIVHRYGFDSVATELAADLKDLFGVESTMVHLRDDEYATLQTGGLLQDGDIVLYDVNPNSATEDNRGRVQGYDEETYGMEIYGGKVYIFATNATGAYWGTRTLLQGLKLAQAESGTPTFPNGQLRDYPEYRVRGLMMDVGRRAMSMDMLKEFVKNMSWYKLNDFHLHLSDNLIWIEEYGYTNNNCTQAQYNEGNKAYAALRLESNVKEEDGANALAAKDYHYSKEEFKEFTEESAALGVTIVPEIDVPAHAKAITDAFPSLRNPAQYQSHALNDHLDLTNKYDESLAVVKEIYGEYLADGTFGGTVHFGADEFYPNFDALKRFTKDMILYLKEQGVTPRVWGSLGNTPGVVAGVDENGEKIASGVQLNLWAAGNGMAYANPQVMYDTGFDIINIEGGSVYIVPDGDRDRGGYGDFLNLSALYNNWKPNNVAGTWLPASSSQMLGGSMAIWQDNIDTHASGLDELDTFTRFFDALPVLATKAWGVGSDGPERTLDELQEDIAVLGYAPNSNPTNQISLAEDATQYAAYDFSSAADQSGNGRDLTLKGSAAVQSGVLALKGNAAYAETGLDRLPWGTTLTFKAMKLSGGGSEQILFENDPMYFTDTFAITALPVAGDTTKWKLGFSRELYDYEFDVELPVGEWVTLALTTAQQSTTLSVDGAAPVAAVGKFVSKANSNTQFKGKTGITNSSFAVPVSRIGSKTNAFQGYIDDVTIGGAPISSFVAATAPSYNGDGQPEYAVDGDP
ncbi:MAG: family 20 glycosylhydrolase, partial [Muribaculaceae bacterium]|nr:family 20 glycosylhydrolase [Muribaculaceae bacterium]